MGPWIWFATIIAFGLGLWFGHEARKKLKSNKSNKSKFNVGRKIPANSGNLLKWTWKRMTKNYFSTKDDSKK